MKWWTASRRCPFFRRFPGTSTSLRASSSRRRSPRAPTSFSRGTPRLVLPSRGGRNRIVSHSIGKDLILEIVSPGDPFGAVAVLNKFTYPASAQAVVPSTVIKLPSKTLFGFIEKHPRSP